MVTVVMLVLFVLVFVSFVLSVVPHRLCDSVWCVTSKRKLEFDMATVVHNAIDRRQWRVDVFCRVILRRRPRTKSNAQLGAVEHF